MRVFEYTPECLTAAHAHGLHLSHDAPAGKSSRPKSIRVFKNGFIETFFAKAHPITPIFWFGPLIGYGVFRGLSTRGPAPTLGLFLAGLLLWSLIEYLLHRGFFHYLLHDLPEKTPEQRFRAFMVHGYHHDYPNDKMRLVAPPLLSWPVALITWLFYTACFGALAPVVFAGTATGYVAYDWIHYYAHHFRPTTALGKWLKSYHLLHHFDEGHGDERYGVTSPLWDLVFSTYRPLLGAPKK